MGLIRQLSEFIHETSYEDLPDTVIQITKMRILDFLGVALTGFRQRIHRPFLQTLQGYLQRSESTVIGEGIKVYCPHAALINSSMCPADLTDGSRLAGLHPSGVVLPAALAVFEGFGKEGRRTGKDLLLAIALGYEVMIRVGRSMNPSAVKRGFHLTPVVGPMGSAVAAGKLWSCDPPTIANGLSGACLFGSGLLSAFKGSESFVGAQISRACEGGIYAALLAREGIEGYPDILETSFLPAFSDRHDEEMITHDLGKEFMIPQTYVRKHAGCRHIHPPIDAAVSLVRRHHIDWAEIEEIQVKTYSVAREMEIDHPRNGDDARFNTPFGIAVALIYGDASYDKFKTQHLNDERIRSVMKKVSLQVSGELDKEYPSKRGTSVSIKAKGKQIVSLGLDFARGEPEFPLSDPEIEGKFESSAEGILEKEKVRKIQNLVKGIETATELSELFHHLTGRKTAADFK